MSDDDLELRRRHATPESVASLLYTSGTTGRPKGCMLTHGNFMTELGVAVEELDALFDEESSTLLFLPLAHVFARIVQIGAVRRRVTLGHAPDIVHLAADLGAFGPTFVLAVPRVFEKLFNAASQNAAADGRGRVFDRAAETAIAYSRALDEGGPGLLLRARHRAFDRMVYRRMREALGGRCRHAISGGAPLGERLGHFYRGIGVTVLEGYGLTETTAAVTVNLPDALKIGSVGRPLGGTAVRVAEDGELAVRGGQVMAGYWRDEEATAAVLSEDGWLLTGDLGEIDDEGFVRVTGRKKEILVTAGGKNVAPAVLEDQLRAHALGQPGDGRGRRTPLHRGPGDPRPRRDRGLGPRPRQGRHRRDATSTPTGWRPGSPMTPTWSRPSRAPSTTPTGPCPRPRRSAASSSWPRTGPRRRDSSRPVSSCGATS